MELSSNWFAPAACYLVLARKMKRKEVAKLFGVSEKRVGRVVIFIEKVLICAYK